MNVSQLEKKHWKIGTIDEVLRVYKIELQCLELHQRRIALKYGKHASTGIRILHIQCYTLTLINTVRWTTIAVTTSVQSTSLSIITAALKDERNFGQPQCCLLLCIVEL